MNIFAVSREPHECAKYLDDKRLNKMLLETMQILSTALYIRNDALDIRKTYPFLYKPTHKHHPCVKWASANYQNWHWLMRLGYHYMLERQKRFPDRDHKCYKVAQSMLNIPYGKMLPYANEISPFQNSARNAELGIDFSHIDDVCLAYRMYLDARWQTDKVKPVWTEYK